MDHQGFGGGQGVAKLTAGRLTQEAIYPKAPRYCYGGYFPKS